MKHSQHMHGWYRYTRGYHLVVLVLALLSACFLLFTAVTPASALTTVPTKMNFQGRLTDASGNIKPNGTYNMRLKLYTVSTAGSAVWSEDRLVSATQGVTVTNGLFSIQLGSITTLPASLFASGSLYLEVELPTPATATSASPVWTEGPMTPRNQMATSAYAYNAETIDGIDSAAFGQLSTANTWSGANTFNGNFAVDSGTDISLIANSNLVEIISNQFSVNTTSNISLQGSDISLSSSGTGSVSVGGIDGIGTVFVLDTKDTAGDPTGANGAMYYNSFSNKLRCYQNGAWADCIGGAGGGITTVGALDGGTANATGATISGSTIYLQSASGTYSGLVNTTTQTFAGNKTFSGALSVNDVSLAAGKSLTVTGGATGTRPASPTEGMVYYDTTTKQLLAYANGKWQADRTEAVVVAAGNSSQADKDAADYVADGNTAGAADGDQVQINAALTAGAGKKVVLLAGTYVADATILIPNNTTFAGVGQGTVIELADLDVTDNLIENSDTTTGTGVTIRDMKLDGRNDLNTAGTQAGVYFSNMGGGSGVTARQGGQITSIISTRFRQYGVYLENSPYNTLDSNISRNNVSGGFFISASSNARFVNNTALGNTSRGLWLSGTSNSTFTGNTFESNGDGLDLSAAANNNSIIGNTFLNNTTGIDIDTAENTVTGNTIEQSSSYGVYLQVNSINNTISSNNFRNNGGTTTNNAIYVTSSDSNTINSNSIIDSSATTNNYAINIFNATSDTNYLADNTLGGGSINDAGTGTIYGGQTDASGNFTIQPAGNINLNKNTTVSAGTLTLGSTSAQGSLVVHDGNGQTGTIRMADTAGSYVYTIPITTANDTFCMLTLANCASGGGVTTVGALDGGTANANGVTISGSTIYLQSASGTYSGLVNTTTQTFAGNKTFSGTLTVSSAATFSGTLTVGSGGDTVSLSTTGLSLAGTARGTKTVTLVPEYLGSTFRGDGTNNTGSLSSDLCSAATGGLGINTSICATANEEHNYYEWANTQATAQDYDIYVRYKLPADYSTGSMTNLKFFAQGTTTSEAATLVMYSGSTQCATTGDVVTVATTWTEGTVASPLGTCTPAAGSYVTFKITLSATQNNQARAGEISLTYRSAF